MIYMDCDYNEGAHEQVLARIVQTNAEQTAGDCLDPYASNPRLQVSCLPAGLLLVTTERARRFRVHVLFCWGYCSTSITRIFSIGTPKTLAKTTRLSTVGRVMPCCHL